MGLYHRVRDENGKVWVVDQWGDRHEPAPPKHWDCWLPMWGPDCEYDQRREQCAHVTHHLQKGWDWGMVDYLFPCPECKWEAEGLGLP